MVREVEVTLRDRERARADIVDGMAGCAHLGMTDLTLPWTAAVDLVAKRNLPCTPHPCRICWKVPGQPGRAVDGDANIGAPQYHIHTGPPMRPENPSDDERRLAGIGRSGTAQPHDQVAVVLRDGEVGVPVVARQHHDRSWRVFLR